MAKKIKDPRDQQFGKNVNQGVNGKSIYSEEFNRPGGKQVAGYDPGYQYPNVVDTQAGEEYAKPARHINLIVLHCSDSDNPNHDNIETIRKWHTERGFTGPDGVEGTEDDVGYHFIITKDGKIHEGRPLSEVGAHVKGHNANSVGICLTGKTPSMFTRSQFRSLRKLLDRLFHDLGLDWKQVKLHNELDSGKTCPNFTRLDAING